jgi:hypothetical protein
MEVKSMPRKWFHIAKAEFYVLTAGMRKHRIVTTAIFYILAFAWAVYLAPLMIWGFITLIMPVSEVQLLMQIAFPGLMRTAVLFLWIMLLLFPLSYALQEIKIGQWEIFLSNDVSTRDIMIGTFLGKIPLYGLVTIIFAPILISPFMMAFEVSLIGQALVYTVLAVTVMVTIWLSNFITGVIQSKLGDSSRGNDLAKAISMVIAVIVIVPMYGLMFFMTAWSEILGMNVFLLLPSTWSADFISWITLTFNGIGLTGSQILGFQDVLQLDMLSTGLLMGGFGLLTVVGGLFTSDRIFTISAGVRTEIVTTTGRENIFLRGIRKVSPGVFGALIITNLKDFLRKAQNLSKIGYGVILAVIMPLIMMSFELEEFSMMEMFPMTVVMFGIVGSLPFAGTGFLESKDQLWIIQGVPHGASRFMKTRIASSVLIIAPVVLIPVITTSIAFQATITEFFMILGFGFLAAFGGVLCASGVTARNPNYEDTKSPAHQANMIMSMMIPQFSMFAWLFLDIGLSIGLNINFFGVLTDIFPGFNLLTIMGMQGIITVLVIGSLLVYSGIRSLSKPEV